jgi:hypothetical protein
MVRNYERRHYFMAIGIAILFISPLLLIIMPSFVVNSLYHEPGTWVVVVPSNSYILYGAGFFLLVVAALTVYFFNVRKIAVLISIGFVMISSLLFYYGTKPFRAISDQGISYREEMTGEINTYTWEDINYIYYYDVDWSEGFDQYEFFFEDGKHIQVTQNGSVMPYSIAISNKLKEAKIDIHWK